ncbi:hypothetical protein GWI33_014737 [Rhynchophorus ferrugineus]|uniref:Uncharacterized protein n=1 Tax=Rhynchophorus ferrugineus TaxID=354439 RepID=A0A834I5J3_RHYFE|nr:hypothetical protein GWI33_014737 [Rhynchophorus ferrugineus]
MKKKVKLEDERFTGYAPTILHFGINPRLSAARQFMDDIPIVHFVDSDKAFAEARERIRGNANKKVRLFTTGDVVAIDDSQVAGGGSQPGQFKGPFIVPAVLPNE